MTNPIRNRVLFEAVCWQNAHLITSPVKADRDKGMAAIMAAFDRAVPRRYTRPKRAAPPPPSPAETARRAEAVRKSARTHYRDTAVVTRRRRIALVAALAAPPDIEQPSHLSAVA